MPFQNNFNFGAGTEDKMIYVLNVQPVIPLKLSEDWNLIARIITPIINQPSLFPGTDSAFGLGDINPTFFLSPAKPGKLIWGGADVHAAHDDRLTARQWQVEHGAGGRGADHARPLGIGTSLISSGRLPAGATRP